MMVSGTTCQEFTENANDYLEGEASWSDWARIRFHLWICPHCREYLEQMDLTRLLLQTTPPQDVDPEVKEEIMKRFKQWSD